MGDRRWFTFAALLALAAGLFWATHRSAAVLVPGPAVADAITDVDWADVWLTLPPNPDQDCPQGRVRVRPHSSYRYGRMGSSRWFQIQPDRPAYGDLTGDGSPEAVLLVRCSSNVDTIEQDHAQLLVVAMRPDHALVGLQFVGTAQAAFPSFHVDGGRLYVQMRYNHASRNSFGGTSNDTAFTQVLRWTGTSFERIAGRTDPLNFTGAHEGYGVPSQLVDISNGSTVVCPAALVPFAFSPTIDGVRYAAYFPVQVLDVDGDGNDELLVRVRCTSAAYDATSLYLLGQGADRFLTRDVPFANDGTYELDSFQASRGGLTVTVTSRVTGVMQVHTFVWSDSRYQAMA